MPGLVGLITDLPPERAKRELAVMVDAQRHESFYEAGTWCDESLGVYIGWTAHQHAFDSKMPFVNEDGQVVLTFCGEEFAEPGTVQRLKQLGHRVNADGASYLVHLYEQDPAFPRSLNGQFHGLVVDRRDGAVILFNDRFGMRRVYYHESKTGFYFAAEAKAILAVRPELRRIDSRSLGELIACGCVLENRTVFQGVSVLPGGSTWSFNRGVLSNRATYFQPSEWEEQAALDAGGYFEQLHRVLTGSVPRYFNGGEPIGMALTGGLDTRLLLAWLKPSPGALKTYTFGSAYRQTEDVKVAHRVSLVVQQAHETITVGNEFLSRFPDYARRTIYLTDACADVTHAPDLYVSERARSIAPVKVVGTYSSEMLSEVPTFKPNDSFRRLFVPELHDEVERAAATYHSLARQHPVTFAAFRQSPWWHYGVLALEQSQLTVRSPFLDNDFVRSVYRAPAGQADIRQRLIAKHDPLLAAIPTDRGAGGNGSRLAAARRLLLDFTYKAEYAYDYGMPQWLARVDRLLSPLALEQLFLGRHKMFHFRVWYRDQLAEYVKSMLLDDRTLSRPYLERPAVEKLVGAHLNGGANYTAEIHKLLTIEHLHRLFVD